MDKAEGLLVQPIWDTQKWYPIILRMCVKPPLVLKPSKAMLHLKNSPTQVHPFARKLHLMVCHVFMKNSQKLNLPERSIPVLMKSWIGSTCIHYNVYIKKWFQYSSQVQCNSCVPNISNVFDFLASLMTEGCGYSAINTARLALP